MLWILLALLAALSSSFSDVFSKKSTPVRDEVVLAFSWRALIALLTFPVLLLSGMPPLGKGFWTALLVSGTINALTTVLYLKAVRSSDLSLTAPMGSVTPLFLLVTSPIILSEMPHMLGVAGIVLIIVGSYLLNASEASKGLLAPFRALLTQKGPRLMLLVAFLWSISSTFDKRGLLNSSPILWIVAINLFISALLLPFILARLAKGSAAPPLRILLPLGVCGSINLLAHMYAISMALVAYVIALKRTSTLMSVFWGYLIFREKGITERIAGAVIIVLGVVLIALS